MKGLKKIALVTAIAAAPFAAHADLKAMDDSAMGNITGQAGVTIELETQVSIGTFTSFSPFVTTTTSTRKWVRMGLYSLTRDQPFSVCVLT